MKQVIVKPIQRAGFRLGLEKHGFNKFPGTGFFVTPLPDQKTGIIQTGISEADRLYLEGELGENLKPGSEFWNTYSIPLFDKENYFDQDNAREFLDMCILRASKFVANSAQEYEDGKFPDAKFIIEDKEAESQVKGAKYQSKMDAFVAIASMTPIRRKQVLTILTNSERSGAPKDYEGQKEEFIKTQLMDFIENPEKTSSQDKNIKKLNELTKKSDDRIDVEYLVTIGAIRNVIRQRHGAYFRGDTEIGYNFDAAVDFLLGKSKSDVRLQIQNELDSKIAV